MMHLVETVVPLPGEFEHLRLALEGSNRIAENTTPTGGNLEVNVKPDDTNFVVIGGYSSPSSYGLWNVGGIEHHPDIHDLVFNPFDNEQLFCSSDVGDTKTITLI